MNLRSKTVLAFHPRDRRSNGGGQRSASPNRTSDDALWDANWP
jgi:hypothetical protein